MCTAIPLSRAGKRPLFSRGSPWFPTALLDLVLRIKRGDVGPAEPLLRKLGRTGSEELVEAELAALRSASVLAE